LSSLIIRRPIDAYIPLRRDEVSRSNFKMQRFESKQRAALLLSNGHLYVGFGGDGNRGALIVFDAQTLAEKAFWTSTPTGTNGGIWQSGQGPAADNDGNVYLMTGNGSFDGNTACLMIAGAMR
jgi:outer membrane protein assembly factor BamB